MDGYVHRGEGAPKVRIRWMFTDLAWVSVEGGIVINNRIWNEDQVTKLDVGQLPLVESNYDQDARWKLPPNLKGKHICHEEWLSDGEPWPTELPDTKYDPAWIPQCCYDPADDAEGGFEIGAEVGSYIRYVDPTAGGMEIGGKIDTEARFVDATAGGLEIGGEAGSAVAYTDAAVGGVEIGGQAGDGYGFTDPTAGGLEIGGEWGEGRAYVDPTAGGLEIGGETSSYISHVDPTAGGLEIGGEVADYLGFTDPTAGGLEIGVEAGSAVAYTDAAVGGVEIGGSAGDVYSSPPSYCPDYFAIELPALLSWTYTGGVVNKVWPDPAGSAVLYSPLYTGTVWRLISMMMSATWETTTAWDGTGTKVFTLVSGSGSPTVSVQSMC